MTLSEKTHRTGVGGDGLPGEPYPGTSRPPRTAGPASPTRPRSRAATTVTTHAHQDRPGRTELGRVLMTGGALSPDWAPAYTNVPRAAFLPDLMWPFDMASGRSVPVSRSDDPQTWQGYADADVPIVTQWDDGRHQGAAPGTEPTSSASMPSVVFRMLRDLTPPRATAPWRSVPAPAGTPPSSRTGWAQGTS